MRYDDKVKVINPARGTYGKIGTVIRTIPGGNVLVNVEFLDTNGGFIYAADELEKVNDDANF